MLNLQRQVPKYLEAPLSDWLDVCLALYFELGLRTARIPPNFLSELVKLAVPGVLAADGKGSYQI